MSRASYMLVGPSSQVLDGSAEVNGWSEGGKKAQEGFLEELGLPGPSPDNQEIGANGLL